MNFTEVHSYFISFCEDGDHDFLFVGVTVQFNTRRLVNLAARAQSQYQ